MLKTLSDESRAGSTGAAETFGDLVFCALIILVLFVLALTIEVSQRVRAELASTTAIEEVSASELSELSKEEVADLSRELLKTKEEIERLRKRLVAKESRLTAAIAAASGEQRFTGAREPASLQVAYDYKNRLYYFHTSREIEHADRRQSGESTFEYIGRKNRELVDIALKTRKQRGYSLEEAKAIYSAFSQFEEVIPLDEGYRQETSQVGIHYHVKLCEYICGDTDSPAGSESMVVASILDVFDDPGPHSDEMYPEATIEVLPDRQGLVLNGVSLSPRDLREILLSFGGRGALLNFTGYPGKPPTWLREKVLAPAGYVGKVPKAPAP